MAGMRKEGQDGGRNGFLLGLPQDTDSICASGLPPHGCLILMNLKLNFVFQGY